MKPVIILIIGFISFIAEGQVTVQYTNERATSIAVETECDADDILVKLESSSIGMLGELHRGESGFIFTPAIPFSPDYTYEVLCKGILISSFSPDPISAIAPQVLEIYPVQDTVPENLLKMHIRFSQPMATGKSYGHITIKENGVPVKPFLELEAELWNEDYTVFTLWLDPGRIKRDLTPNKEYGNPLVKGNAYELIIDSLWRDQHNRPLKDISTYSFVAGERDEKLPSPKQWKIDAGMDRIKVMFNEPMDYLLMTQCLTLWENNTRISIRVNRIANRGVELIPDQKLGNGMYTLKVDPRLEDLAGNNLIRPFDLDLESAALSPAVTEINFAIQERQ